MKFKKKDFKKSSTQLKRPILFYHQEYRKCTHDANVMYFLIFVKLYTSQIVTPCNPQWSHNVAHNCDHDTFNVDCCYDILQHLLRICMSTKKSVLFHVVHHPHRQSVEIF